MQDLHFTEREAIFYLALIGAGVGLIIGLIPFAYGWAKGKLKLGLLALVISAVVGGAISALLSLLVAVIFIFLIARRAPLESASQEPADESPDDDDRVL